MTLPPGMDAPLLVVMAAIVVVVVPVFWVMAPDGARFRLSEVSHTVAAGKHLIPADRLRGLLGRKVGPSLVDRLQWLAMSSERSSS